MRPSKGSPVEPTEPRRLHVPERRGIAVERFVDASLSFERGWHAHGHGFLGGVDVGWIGVHLGRRTCLLPPGTMCWLPPREPHAVDAIGAISGWMLLLPPRLSLRLPREPLFASATELVRALVPRLTELAPSPGGSLALRRLVDVLLDEVRRAPPGHVARLPLPRSDRLRPALAEVLLRPGAGRSLDDVARRCAMSRRTFIRAFRDETGTSFAAWQRSACVVRALSMLRDGRSVKETAQLLGYRSPSAFVAMFRAQTGRTPAAAVAEERGQAGFPGGPSLPAGPPFPGRVRPAQLRR